ncbi:MAG: hypothetical protein ACR2NN_06530 [Bryobacteraceae bacterium]
MQANISKEVSQLSMSVIKELAAASGPCISILLPIERDGVRSPQNHTRLKHAIETAGQLLADKTQAAVQAKPLMATLHDLARETQDWSGDHKSLALFRSPEMFQVFRLALEVPESVTVGDHFMIAPLLPLLNADQTFYILALSQKHIRLLRCAGHSSEEVPLPDSVPATLWEDKQSDQPDHDQNNRGSAGPSVGAMKGVMSTTNTDREDRDEYLLHFYKHVSKGVNELLKNESAPLVIAGVDYEIALFRRENSYPYLAEGAVHGAADGLKGGELHKRALEAVQSYFEAPLKQALERFEKQGNDRSSTTVKEIVKAAFDGRVSELILAEGARYMGNFDESTDSVRGHKQPLPGDEDLLNAAAAQTILHAGHVFVVPASKVPHGAPAIALFRY